MKVLVFKIGTEAFALEVTKIQNVVESPRLNPIPLAPSFFRGVINFHNRIIPVLDMVAYLGMSPQEEDARVIVLDPEQVNLGLSVTSIGTFSDLEEAQSLAAMPNSALTSVSRLVNSINDKPIHILDPAHLNKSLESDMAAKSGRAVPFLEPILFVPNCEGRQDLPEVAAMPLTSSAFSLSSNPTTSSR